jgi:tRNA(fMet)-specific endonuclease VapC
MHHADVFLSIISVQESVQGWLALINRKKSGREQLHAYARFQQCIEALSTLAILPFDEHALRIFADLQRRRLRAGSMDLKIAAICLAHDALLLTRNLSDFQKVYGLRVENWLD